MFGLIFLFFNSKLSSRLCVLYLVVRFVNNNKYRTLINNRYKNLHYRMFTIFNLTAKYTEKGKLLDKDI